MTMRLHWQGDNARLFEGDARALDGLGAGSVNLVVTSPPYWNARREYASWPTYADYLADMARAWAECYRVLGEGGRIVVNVPDGYGRPGSGGYLTLGDDTARALRAAGFELRGKVIWYKGGAVARNSTAWGSWRSASNPSLRDCYEVLILAHKGAARRPGPALIDVDTFLAATVSVWEVQPARSKWHPAPFPPEIPRRLIRFLSFPGDVILDPFTGTAATVWEAVRAGRQGIGVDACAAYLDRAVTDWQATEAPQPAEGVCKLTP
jgi:site-specific DNA-methyltransferase (adenine-specific)